MNKIILLFLIFQSAIAQTQKDISIFHRLVILNSENELMVVKIKNTDFWVTPGLYQTKETPIKQGLKNTALTYGIEIDTVKLNGVFVLQREINEKKTTSLRNIYTAKVKGGTLKNPKGIDVIKWLPIDKAIELITFPHIKAMVKKISTNPNKVWGGTLLQFKENKEWKTKILEDFYPL